MGLQMRIGGIKKWMGDGHSEAPRAPPPVAPQPPPPRARRWPRTRLDAVEALWGPGYASPGGPAETLRLAKPLGLTDQHSLLLLGGGMGGPAETISGTLGAWVDSFEADPELAGIAEQRRATHPAARRMRVAGWDRAHPAFQRRSAHHALALEALRGAPPEPVLVSLAAALRPSGHMVITELVAENPAPPEDREYAAWCRLENRLPDLPRLDTVTTTLNRLHFDVRVIEDVSDRHVADTLAGWRAAVKSMAAGPRPDAATAAVFVTEAELWLLRIRLMRRFGFRLLRWHAIGAA
jgi:cyclopropane fatty-acyl-phospholipid synthase-like methyltransferase